MAAPTHPLNEECITLFRSGVERILGNWTALKLAVDHGTGGPRSQELADNLVQYIGDIFCEGGNVEPEDISDVLVEVMDTQFDTWLEDNSQDEISSLLCKLYQMCLQGNVDELKKEVDNLPVSRANQSRQWNPEPREIDQSLAPVPEANTGDLEMDEESEPQEEEEPGWTQVTRRRRVP
ncbi:Uncharacterized protein GBIM_14241 [Gryllus bimaculatus]|nr:Uncharacterized protein GBIM_14241 [Gryllus bimaculatus]